jgi:glycosyltransferase involved in cell wall biosynthesis
MQNWLDLADEIIVVDSHSTDGTNELIRQNLHHPNLKIIERQPGLYESWNQAITATSGKWIYISTVGDVISRQHLEKLLNLGETHGVDVVISPQRFTDEDGQTIMQPAYCNPKIYEVLKGRGIAILPPSATHFYAFVRGKPNALLGSVASDLFNGDHLRARPFSTEYGTHGDTAWLLKYARETRLCLLPECGSDFCLHRKHAATSEPIIETMRRMYQTELPPEDTSDKFFTYRFLLKKTSQLWFEKKISKRCSLMTKVAKTLTYLYFRSWLTLKEKKIGSQIKRQICFFES